MAEIIEGGCIAGSLFEGQHGAGKGPAGSALLAPAVEAEESTTGSSSIRPAPEDGDNLSENTFTLNSPGNDWKRNRSLFNLTFDTGEVRCTAKALLTGISLTGYTRSNARAVKGPWLHPLSELVSTCSLAVARMSCLFLEGLSNLVLLQSFFCSQGYQSQLYLG